MLRARQNILIADGYLNAIKHESKYYISCTQLCTKNMHIAKSAESAESAESAQIK